MTSAREDGNPVYVNNEPRSGVRDFGSFFRACQALVHTYTSGWQSLFAYFSQNPYAEYDDKNGGEDSGHSFCHDFKCDYDV